MTIAHSHSVVTQGLDALLELLSGSDGSKGLRYVAVIPPDMVDKAEFPLPQKYERLVEMWYLMIPVGAPRTFDAFDVALTHVP